MVTSRNPLSANRITASVRMDVTPGARAELRGQQRITVEEWATWVGRERRDLPLTHARFLVHAALNVVTDLSRLKPQPAPERIEALSTRILLGDNS